MVLQSPVESREMMIYTFVRVIRSQHRNCCLNGTFLTRNQCERFTHHLWISAMKIGYSIRVSLWSLVSPFLLRYLGCIRIYVLAHRCDHGS